MPQILRTFSREVALSRKNGMPMIALQSTILTHGMRWPENVGIAARVGAEIRAAGAVPATMAVLQVRIHIGLNASELNAPGQFSDLAKLSRADLAGCVVRGGNGATTVAATMICTRPAGITAFATGGIGGVHRGAETSFDFSADLQELPQTPVKVVAAGCQGDSRPAEAPALS